MTKKHSAATRRKMSLAKLGNKNSFYGRRHKKSTLARLSAKNKGKNNPMSGHRHSAAAREKMRQAALKRSRKAK